MATTLPDQNIVLKSEIRTRNICIDTPENGSPTIRVERQEVYRLPNGTFLASKAVRTLSFSIERMKTPSRLKLMSDIAATCDAIDDEILAEQAKNIPE